MTFRLTYGATLAELTSLEEMMRILTESRQVHVDVINKLWQVYSTYSDTGSTYSSHAYLSVFKPYKGTAEAAKTRRSHDSWNVGSGQSEDS